MRRATILTALASLTACGRNDVPASREPARDAQPAGDSTLVVVNRPTAIGFFPPAKDSAEAMQDAYSEGLSHLRFALEDAKACLGNDSAQTVLVVDTAVRIRVGDRVDTLRFSKVDSLSFGAYLISPDAAPKLVTAGAPSALMHAVTAAIPDYFHRPACRK
jgi:hypothetical protein